MDTIVIYIYYKTIPGFRKPMSGRLENTKFNIQARYKLQKRSQLSRDTDKPTLDLYTYRISINTQYYPRIPYFYTKLVNISQNNLKKSERKY